jgi:hypothetical protein
MAKYRIVKREYPNGNVEYEVQKKVLGLFWWNFENVDSYTTGLYSSLEGAERAIKMKKEKTKVTIIKV